ncbi:HD domain-containing protein [Halobacillus salinus]|uniref:Bifunctional (P)ppGpp synthetase/guanosine-3',5'-bis(Diphosphate) 3'-pyrophosphohydrolase n=1 Tax=Halobacillus salinus TaxID=192814 RepID=A0A4Z0GW84_9BACI|nr:HD domain-containing protein [Halobacillus salinus]TGB02005.1 bifunctional (p)ppGpp synthetase/guanosine-3',5'-bis(diphosphate) 3'-pyrophosphohydrolase [Halobacillus salinus]
MIEKAKQYATEAHRGQKRKGSDEDYVRHPIRVAKTLQEAGFNEATVCAGYLHDVVEDTDITLDDIEQEFGKEVAVIVAAHTEDKEKSWQERKQHTITVVKESSLDIKALIVADKLDNLQSISEGLSTQGDELWRLFNAGYEHQKWYYQSVAQAMGEGLKSEPAFFRAYSRLVHLTFH